MIGYETSSSLMPTITPPVNNHVRIIGHSPHRATLRPVIQKNVQRHADGYSHKNDLYIKRCNAQGIEKDQWLLKACTVHRCISTS